MLPRFDHFPASDSARLAALYTRTMAGYLLIMAAVWQLGLEGIYGHPTPFYALYAPSTGTAVGGVLTALLLLYGRFAIHRAGDPRPQQNAWFLPVMIVALSAAGGFLLAGEARRAGHGFVEHGLSVLPAIAWQLPALAVSGIGAVLFVRIVLPRLTADSTLSSRETVRLLWGIFGFSVAFAFAIAMMRGGFHGIDQAYARAAYEYAGDIGKTRTIRDLFGRYLEIHEHLSMHAKVHPPGPIALLWLFSLVLLSSSAMPLSVATVLFSSLAVFPLYGWTKRVTDQRTALIACVCYVVVPSVVLFTATSADALFTPFTLTTLYCFERAIRTRSARFALLSGAGYGVMMLLKFSLIGIGAYFGLVGLWMMRRKETRLNVIVTAALMVFGVGAVLGGVHLWSGYDLYENFKVAKLQFDTDQAHLDELAPRLPSWTYKFLNPACWFYFGGIPISLLFLRELLGAEKSHRAPWALFLLTLLALNILYLARGEGERSALYMIPFVLIPAARQLARMTAMQRSGGPLFVTLAFLAFQSWFTELFFYTYW